MTSCGPGARPSGRGGEEKTMIDKGKQALMPSLTTTECRDKECEKDVKVKKRTVGIEQRAKSK